MTDYLTTLPVELIYKILDNVPSIDVLSSVCFVNKCLRSIFLTYHRFQLNFSYVNTLMNKSHFDSICTQLLYSTSQIVSLTLFDKDDMMTSVKNELFFSRFSIIDTTFPNLRSLNLTFIEYETWCLFKTRLPPLIVTLSICLFYSDILLCLSTISVTFSELLFLSPLFQRLSAKVADFMYGDVKIYRPNSSISSSIQYLHLENVTIDSLDLLTVAPMLHTLEVRFSTQNLNLSRTYPPLLYLQRLRIELWAITWTEMVILLSSFPCLTYLVVIAGNVKSDMADGFAWARLLQQINHFEFELQFSNNAFEQQPLYLDSFCTKFWLEEKKWLVTYDRGFSYDECSMHYSTAFPFIVYPTRKRIRTFIPGSIASESTFFSHVHHLRIDDRYLKCQLLHQRINIKKLYLSKVTVTIPTTLKDLMVGHDTSQITTCDIGPEWNKNSPYEHIEFLRSLPRLRRLEISGISLNCFFLHQWPYIVDLKIKVDFEHKLHILSSNDIDALCHSFPHIERLDIHSLSVPDLAQLLNRMKMTLREVLIKQSSKVNNEQLITRQWIERNTNLKNFHYRCNDRNRVRLWL